MSIPLRINEAMYDLAKKSAKSEYRTTALQIEYWARIGKAALDNPDLPIEFIRDILVVREQEKDLVEAFIPEGTNEKR